MKVLRAQQGEDDLPVKVMENNVHWNSTAASHVEKSAQVAAGWPAGGRGVLKDPDSSLVRRYTLTIFSHRLAAEDNLHVVSITTYHPDSGETHENQVKILRTARAKQDWRYYKKKLPTQQTGWS